MVEREVLQRGHPAECRREVCKSVLLKGGRECVSVSLLLQLTSSFSCVVPVSKSFASFEAFSRELVE